MRCFLSISVVVIMLTSCDTQTSTVSAVELIPTMELESVVIDHVLKFTEGCRISRVKFFMRFTNPTKSSVLLNKGQKQYFCFWNDLKPMLIVKSSKYEEDSLSLGIIKEYSIPPHTSGLIECVVLNKTYVGSLKIIRDKVGDWITSDCSFKGVSNLKNVRFLMVNERELKMTYVLDDEIINQEDSLKMNMKYKMSLEEAQSLLKEK